MGTSAAESTGALWSGHQLLGFSGLDGPTHWERSPCAATLADRLGLRVDLSPPLTVTFSLRRDGLAEPLVPSQLARCDVGAGGFDLAVIAGGSALELRLRLSDDSTLEGEAVWHGDEAAELIVELDAGGPPPEEVVLTPAGDGLPLSPRATFSLSLSGRPTPAPRGVPAPVPPATDGVPASLRGVRARALSILRCNVFAPEAQIGRRWLSSQRLIHRACNTSHAAFYAQALDDIDPALGDGLLAEILGHLGGRGLLPALLWPGGQSETNGPPLICWAVWRRWRDGRGTDPSALAAVLRAYVKYPLGARMLSRHGYARSQAARLLSWGHGEGSGMDNSPRFEQGEPFAAVDLNAYVAAELERLAQILTVAHPGSREPNHYAWLGEELAAEARAYFWDDDAGLFRDRYPDDDPVPARTIACLIPLFAGLADGPQADRLIREHLLDPHGFWTAFPLASLAADDPRCDGNQWRGGVWPGLNVLLVEGLRRYGYHTIADELRQRTIDEIARWYESTGTLWEYYDAGARRSPAELPRGRRVGALPEYAWTAAALLMLLNEGRP